MLELHSVTQHAPLAGRDDARCSEGHDEFWQRRHVAYCAQRAVYGLAACGTSSQQINLASTAHRLRGVPQIQSSVIRSSFDDALTGAAGAIAIMHVRMTRTSVHGDAGLAIARLSIDSNRLVLAASRTPLDG